jgi:eukaryotic-like serine/threonine-protein kinase
MSDYVIGKYRFVVEIGKGGMADVFLAVAQGPIGINKLLVIKRLKADMAEDPELVSMQIDEARLAARLNHPNVVQTIEVAEDGGQYFIAMEYLEGQPLNRIVNRSARKKPMPLAMRLRIICEALGGLHYAHELLDFDGSPLNVVHRDATPQNIFVTYDGQVKLVDFGIAKASKREAETRIGVIKGKIPYMGPQQAAGLPVDRRADIFAIGVILWEALAETRMWKDIDDLVIVHKLMLGQVPKLRDFKPDVNPELERIVNRSISHELDERYGTALEFQRDIEKYIESSGERVSNREVGAFVAELFAERRAEMKRIIDNQLMALHANSRQSYRPKRIYPDGGGSTEAPSSDMDRSIANSSMLRVPSSERDLSVAVRGESMAPGDVDATGMPVTSSGRESLLAQRKSGGSADDLRSSRRRRIVPLAALGFVAVALGSWAALRQRAPSEDRSSAVPPPSSAPAVTTAPPSEERISVTLKTNVPSAKFSVDNGVPLDNPFVGRFMKDGSQHQVRVEAPGYKTKTTQIMFSADVMLDLALERESSSTPKHVAPGRPRPHPVVQPQPPPQPVVQPQPPPPTKDPNKPKEIDTADPWGK